MSELLILYKVDSTSKPHSKSNIVDPFNPREPLYMTRKKDSLN